MTRIMIAIFLVGCGGAPPSKTDQEPDLGPAQETQITVSNGDDVDMAGAAVSTDMAGAPPADLAHTNTVVNDLAMPVSNCGNEGQPCCNSVPFNGGTCSGTLRCLGNSNTNFLCTAYSGCGALNQTCCTIGGSQTYCAPHRGCVITTTRTCE